VVQAEGATPEVERKRRLPAEDSPLSIA